MDHKPAQHSKSLSEKLTVSFTSLSEVNDKLVLSASTQVTPQSVCKAEH